MIALYRKYSLAKTVTILAFTAMDIGACIYNAMWDMCCLVKDGTVYTWLMIRGVVMQGEQRKTFFNFKDTEPDEFIKVNEQSRKRNYQSIGNQCRYENVDQNNNEPMFGKDLLLSCETNIGDFNTRVLMNEKDIGEAKALIYQFYFEEETWMWPSDNPTGFKIEIVNCRKIISDNYDDSSFWIGVFSQEELVSCMRIVYRTKDSNLDIEGYEDAKKPAISKVLEEKNIIEMQRYVTKPEYRYKGLNVIIVNVLAKILLAKPMTAIATSKINFVSSYGCGKTLDEQFDYGDGVHTNVMFWSLDDIEKILKETSRALQRIRML